MMITNLIAIFQILNLHLKLVNQSVLRQIASVIIFFFIYEISPCSSFHYFHVNVATIFNSKDELTCVLIVFKLLS